MERPSNLDIVTTIHILAQLEREVDAERLEQNQMSRFRDKCAFLADKMKETDAKLTAEVDEIIDRLTNALPAKAETAFGKARATLDGYHGGVADIEAGINILSNSDPLADSSEQSGQSPDRPTQPQS